MNDLPACPCGHEQADDEPNTCLIPDADGRKHKVPHRGRHCICHGYPVTTLERRRTA